MKLNEKLKFENCFKLPNPSLRSYFERVVNGQPDEYRTPFYKGWSLKQILDEWEKELVAIEQQWPSLMEFENDLRKKVGPMSIMFPLKDRISDIDSYYDSILLESKPVSTQAIDCVIQEMSQVRGLRLKSERATLENMRLSTNSGAPYFSRRKSVVSKTVPCDNYYTNDGYSVSHLPTGRWSDVAILGWRGQEGGPTAKDVKQRVVWMFPFSVNIQELRCYQPLITAAQHFNIVPAWISMDAVDERITKLFDSKNDKDLIVCTDFSKFDQHFNHDMQQAAQTILSKLFTKDSNFNEWMENVFPIKYNIPLAYDWKTLRAGKHGMASGSGGTNCDETLTHRALQYEAALNQGKILNPNSQCLGDDGLLSYPGITVEDVVDTYSSHGQEMNTDKQYASTTDCTYLRRWHHRDYRMNNVCVGVYSTYRALGRLAEQERYYDPDLWSNKMVALRYLSILENCKYHPLREKFADFCMKGDKFRLGIDIPGFLDNIESEASKAIDLMPDFLGYTKTQQMQGQLKSQIGIADWWIVKYLKSKA